MAEYLLLRPIDDINNKHELDFYTFLCMNSWGWKMNNEVRLSFISLISLFTKLNEPSLQLGEVTWCLV